jgi:hypothetical protein
MWRRGHYEPSGKPSNAAGCITCSGRDRNAKTLINMYKNGYICLIHSCLWRFLSLPNPVKARSESPILTFTHPLNGTSQCPGPSDSIASSISTLTFVIAAVDPSKSSPTSRTRTSSIASWLIFERERTRPPYPIAPVATLPSSPWAITSFRRTRVHRPTSARTLLKNVWCGRLHAIVQE